MAVSDHERIGSLVRRGILLFAGYAPFPCSSLIAAVAAAVLTKTLDVADRRVSEALSRELELQHIPYVEPGHAQLLDFYARNPVYPDLAAEFRLEITARDLRSLSDWYPYLYSALILKRSIPALLFHKEIEEHRYRQLAVRYKELSQGYAAIGGKPEVEEEINHFAGELMEVLNEAYGAAREELINKDNREVFDLIDYIKEVAQA